MISNTQFANKKWYSEFFYLCRERKCVVKSKLKMLSANIKKIFQLVWYKTQNRGIATKKEINFFSNLSSSRTEWKKFLLDIHSCDLSKLKLPTLLHKKYVWVHCKKWTAVVRCNVVEILKQLIITQKMKQLSKKVLKLLDMYPLTKTKLIVVQ